MSSLQSNMVDWIRLHLGPVGGIAVGTVAIAYYLWKNWHDIQSRPFVADFREWLQRHRPLPKATTNKFSIALTHLIDDDGRRAEQLVVEDLREFNGIELLRLDREIPDGNISEAKLCAKTLAQSVGASVLLWGRVLHNDGTSRVRIYWSVNNTGIAELPNGTRYSFTEDLMLPELFWADMIIALNVLVSATHAELDSLDGTYTAAQVAPFVAKLRTLIDDTQTQWSPPALTSLHLILGSSLFSLSEQTGDNSTLQTAIRYSRSALTVATQGTAEYLRLQLILAGSLARLGERMVDRSLLNEARSIHQTLTANHVREAFPELWFIAQWNYAADLHIVAERFSETPLLSNAIHAYREALEYKRGSQSPERAMILHNLGGALHRLSEREHNEELLAEAIDTFNEALRVRTRAQLPLYWALTTFNLANAVLTRGTLLKDSNLIEESARLYRSALEELPRWQFPIDWAMTQAGLGRALRRLGSWNSDVPTLVEAEEALRRASSDYTRRSQPLLWSDAMDSLGSTLAARGHILRDARLIREGLIAYGNALDERPIERVPLLWCATKNNIAQANRLMYQLDECVEHLEHAATCLRQALSIYQPESRWLEWAGCANSLGQVCALIGARRDDPLLIHEAIEMFETLSAASAPPGRPWDRLSVTISLANMLLMLNRIEPSQSLVERATIAVIEAYRESGGQIRLYGEGFSIELPPALDHTI